MNKEMTKEVAIVTGEDFGLEKNEAIVIEQSFQLMVAARDDLLKEHKELASLVMNEETCELWKQHAKKLMKLRKGIEKNHKVQKDYFWQAGKFCDALKNRDTFFVTEMEGPAKAKAKHFEILEEKRMLQLRADRIAALEAIGSDASFDGVAQMPDPIWESFYAGEVSRIKQDKADAKAKAEALKAAAEAEAKEQERIRKENAKLKAEAEKREKQIADENKERSRLAKIESDKREEIEVARQAEDAKKQAAHDAELKAERDEKNQLAQIEAERVADEKMQAAKSADKEHCRKINARIVDQMMVIAPELSKEKAIELVKAFVTGKVEDVSINY